MNDEREQESGPAPAPVGACEEASAIAADPWTRRVFLQCVAGGTGLVMGQRFFAMPTVQAAPPVVPTAPDEKGVELHFRVNGQDQNLRLDPRVTLLDALRERLGLAGTKKGCDHGQCGACTVLVNGRRINSCLSLALTHEGDEITTIEGLAHGEELHPVQAAFVEHDGFQCGYCTPGQVCSAVGLLHEKHAGSDDEIREWMSGNLCRCGAYANILAAIRSARTKMESKA